MEQSDNNLDDNESGKVPFQFEFNDDVFNSEIQAYVLYLSCIMAYYGNGSVSAAEMKDILDFSDVLIEKSIPDRELVKKEILLEILDSLKAELEKEESPEDKFQLALYSADFFSKKIHDTIKDTYKEKSEREDSCDTMFRRFEHILKIDNKSLSKNEKRLLTKIRHNLGIVNFLDIVLGCALVVVLGPIAVFLLYLTIIVPILAD